eukprot:2876953-Heterocapsa_arctica.AAC.1
MRPPAPPAGRQPDLVAKALGAAPVQAKVPSTPMAQSLMTKPGSVPQARSKTPRPVNVHIQRNLPPAAPALNIRLPDRTTLRTWILDDSDWVRFAGGRGYEHGISWADAIKLCNLTSDLDPIFE